MLQNARPSRSSSTLGAISFISISLNAHSLVLSQPTRPSRYRHGTHTRARAGYVPNEDGQQVKECADEGEHSERDNGSAQGLQLLQRAIAFLVDKHSPPLADHSQNSNRVEWSCTHLLQSVASVTESDGCSERRTR